MGKCGYRDKGRRVEYWARLGYWISPCYSSFLLGACFETYEPFISLIFLFLFQAAVDRRYGGPPVYTANLQNNVSYRFINVLIFNFVCPATMLHLCIILQQKSTF